MSDEQILPKSKTKKNKNRVREGASPRGDVCSSPSLPLIKMLQGAVLFARKTIESEIFFWKPDKWFKIWFFLISKVSHTDNKLFSKGESFVTYQEISYFTKANKNQIDKFMRWAKKETMLTTRKTTRGMIVKLNKYGVYQNFKTYKRDTQDETKTKQRRNKDDTIYNNDNNDNNDKETTLQKVVNFYFSLKDYPEKWCKQNYARHCKPAKRLLALTDNNPNEVITMIKKANKHFGDKGLSWKLETVEKNWNEIKKSKGRKRYG